MNHDNFFHDWLDDHPGDHGARLLLAEILDDSGDANAAGLRWMAAADKYPSAELVFSLEPGTWDWWSMLPGWNGGIDDSNDKHDRLPSELMKALDHYRKKSNWSGDCAFCEYATRRAAEAALCRALAGSR